MNLQDTSVEHWEKNVLTLDFINSHISIFTQAKGICF